ncbi:MAG: hypothetical protein HYV51_01495 [Parcubacteria group bacterium]|nr:hypothetical protein [Parcubacteria group bacterium]
MTSYSYALSRVKKFNDFIINDRVLRYKFVLSEYNFLQVYQALIFNDFKFLYETKSPDPYLLHRNGFNFKATIKKLISILVSVWGYVFLILSRHRVLVYASDKISESKFRCDFRMANLYKQLFLKNVKFVEILHTAYDENFYDYVIKRGRPALYLESVDLFYKIFNKFNFKESEDLVNTEDFSSFGEEAEFARLLLKKYLAMIAKTRFRINCISKLLKLSGVKNLICVPDTRNYHELVESCRLNKIKTYAFQSGALSKYDVGLLDFSGLEGNIIKPNKFFLSSQYWIDELFRLSSIFEHRELAIGGDIKEDRSDANSNISQRQERAGITALVSYETQAPKDEVKKHILKMLNCLDTRVIFSIRPGRNIEAQFAEYGLEDMPENFSATDNLNKAVNDADFIAGTQSTLMYDMVGYYKPVIILKTEMDMLEGMVFNGLADTIDINNADFCQRLRKVKETSFEILAQRKKRLYEGAISLNSTLNEILS